MSGSNRLVKSGLFLGLFGILMLGAGFAIGWEDSREQLPAYSDLNVSVSEAVKAEQDRGADLRSELTRLEEFQRAVNAEFKTWRIQLSTHGNLLLLPGVAIADLERAAAENKAAINAVQGRIKTLSTKKESTDLLLQQTRDRSASNRSQLADIAASKDKNKEAANLSLKIKSLLVQYAENEKLLGGIQKIYSTLLDQGQTLQTSLAALSGRIAEEIQSRKKQNLFTRKPLPLDSTSWAKTKENWRHLLQLVQLLAPKALGAKWQSLNWNPEGIQLITFMLFLGLVLYVFSRFSGYGKRLLPLVDKDRLPYRYLTVLLIQRSMMLIGITLFVYGHMLVTPLINVVPLFRLLFRLLLILLLSGMAKRFVAHWFLEQNRLQHREAVLMLRMVSIVRLLGLIYGIMDWAMDSDRLILFALRMLLLLSIFLMLMRFWKNVQSGGRENQTEYARSQTALIGLLKGMSYAVVGVGVVLDIVGYNSLALYWTTSWGVSIVITMWAGLFFSLLMEWRFKMKAETADTAQEPSGNGQPIRWLILQVAWLVWFFSFVFGLILAWGGRQAVIVRFVRSLNHPITIGKITFSITNFVAAFFILVVTHSLIRFGRFVLKEKILSESGLESGLQDSITTITVYAFWAFGILLSLHAFGLGTTSLALAFGALGIGLGFGLQNIFNNFISGIIMLFERPIQVGDDVEINGVWATVKKINVRATVVQTYDNASLIIPNSEFISSQVTNWSFKDKRLRRSIDVGVAYGSNIDRVRQTLLEIAEKTKNVFKTPPPDVLFKDFGDSALLFRLRVWTDIDNMLKVETAIRFDIDQLFKERGIVIAFPQLDVHLHPDNVMPDA